MVSCGVFSVRIGQIGGWSRSDMSRVIRHIVQTWRRRLGARRVSFVRDSVIVPSRSALAHDVQEFDTRGVKRNSPRVP